MAVFAFVEYVEKEKLSGFFKADYEVLELTCNSPFSGSESPLAKSIRRIFHPLAIHS